MEDPFAEPSPPKFINFETKKHSPTTMTITVEILNEHALILLRELEEMRVIRLSHQPDQVAVTSSGKKKEFKAIRLDTRGFKFNREEANER